jgi:hypothetical protein
VPRRLHEHRDGADGGTREKEENRFLALLFDFSSSSTSSSSQNLDLDLSKKTQPKKKKHVQEYVNGQLKNKYGDAFIRGNNVLYISTDKGSSSC